MTPQARVGVHAGGSSRSGTGRSAQPAESRRPDLNGATYRMIPAVFRVGATTPGRTARSRKAAAGCIGIAGAVGAFGGFLIPRGFAVSDELAGSLQPALMVFVGVYLVLAATTWAVYQRRGAAMSPAGI